MSAFVSAVASNRVMKAVASFLSLTECISEVAGFSAAGDRFSTFSVIAIMRGKCIEARRRSSSCLSIIVGGYFGHFPWGYQVAEDKAHKQESGNAGFAEAPKQPPVLDAQSRSALESFVEFCPPSLVEMAQIVTKCPNKQTYSPDCGRHRDPQLLLPKL
ncbi:MAG: hypothetical protein KGR48_05200 [Alphaproteobacteria bacterium]|nr:hypothetical protein [Alphaproteobacteria bacterium]MDE2014561.1 hypothetical protein [Alphaproteobacteria bacterium]MDE2072358.1 hypothetical protein [Alphaproteobacteria bacterium]MDE2351559.1 hypothetical protein [Alphaproteobacteria bacterium]